jgi:hypothetical protein
VKRLAWTLALAAIVGFLLSPPSAASGVVPSSALSADCSATSGTLFVGSKNFSTSSLDYHHELGVVAHSASVIKVVWSTLVAGAAMGTRLKPLEQGVPLPVAQDAETIHFGIGRDGTASHVDVGHVIET